MQVPPIEPSAKNMLKNLNKTWSLGKRIELHNHYFGQVYQS